MCQKDIWGVSIFSSHPCILPNFFLLGLFDIEWLFLHLLWYQWLHSCQLLGWGNSIVVEKWFAKIKNHCPWCPCASFVWAFLYYLNFIFHWLQCMYSWAGWFCWWIFKGLVRLFVIEHQWQNLSLLMSSFLTFSSSSCSEYWFLIIIHESLKLAHGYFWDNAFYLMMILFAVISIFGHETWFVHKATTNCK